MANTQSKTITVEQLEDTLMNGGWTLRGGRLGKSLALIPNFSEERGELLVHQGYMPEDDSPEELNRRGSLVYTFTLERITIVSFGDEDAYRLEVRGPALVTQQCKKSEGGGTQNVLQDDVILFLFVEPHFEAKFLRTEAERNAQVG